jgi:hypothetical protein
MDAAETRQHIVTMEELRDAIAYTLCLKNGGNRAESEKVAQGMAEYLLNMYGYSDAIIDNTLETDDRDNFYLLEDDGVLSTRKEEINLLKGKVWRVHYWLLNKTNILGYAAAYRAPPESKEEDPAAIYKEMPDVEWQRTTA